MSCVAVPAAPVLLFELVITPQPAEPQAPVYIVSIVCMFKKRGGGIPFEQGGRSVLKNDSLIG